jgi:hypothetical protein
MRAKSEDPQSKQMVVFFKQRKSHSKNDPLSFSRKVCSTGRGHWPLNHCYDHHIHHRTTSHISSIQSLEIEETPLAWSWLAPVTGRPQRLLDPSSLSPSVVRLHAKIRARRPPSTSQTSQPGDSLSLYLDLFPSSVRPDCL